MAIKKHKDLTELTDKSTTTTTTTTCFEEKVSAPTIRSQELSRSGRSDVFLREHTHLRRNPTIVTCPNCLQGVETIVERRCTSTTHLSALLMLPVCFCALPYYSKILRDSIHRCPSCGITLGAYFASAREAFVVCCMNTQQDHQQSRCAATSGEAQFF